MIEHTPVRSVEEFVGKVKADSRGWSQVWFRGEPANVTTPLLPRVYRLRDDGTQHNENRLLQTFRLKAPGFATSLCPDLKATDQWLFLAQHVGLPTRLLDWTEGALIGLHFALTEPAPVVWMLDPIKLNEQSVTPGTPSTGSAFPLTWHSPEGVVNIGSINIRGAWGVDAVGTALPVAIPPTNVHPRISVQRSCFTVHGKDKRSLADQASSLLRRYHIDPNDRDALRKDLRLLGISHSTLWPDLDGLAEELGELY
jgi:hypothetical protein